jgi:hypothetical protein
MTTAFNTLDEAQQLTRRQAGLCKHYGMRPSWRERGRGS